MPKKKTADKIINAPTSIIPVEQNRDETCNPVEVSKKVDSSKFANILSLNCYPEVRDKLRMGHTIEEVCRFIQDDRHELCEYPRQQVELALYRFRSSIPIQDFVALPPMRVREAIATLKRGTDELQELDSLYLLQLRRINIDFTTEEKINKLFNTTNAEIRLAADILSKKAAIKAAMGDRLSTPEVSSLQFTATVTDNKISEETKVRLGVIAKNMLTAIEKMPVQEENNVIDAEFKSGGTENGAK